MLPVTIALFKRKKWKFNIADDGRTLIDDKSAYDLGQVSFCPYLAFIVRPSKIDILIFFFLKLWPNFVVMVFGWSISELYSVCWPAIQHGRRSWK